jgi:hypothetical protein
MVREPVCAKLHTHNSFSCLRRCKNTRCRLSVRVSIYITWGFSVQPALPSTSREDFTHKHGGWRRFFPDRRNESASRLAAGWGRDTQLLQEPWCLLGNFDRQRQSSVTAVEAGVLLPNTSHDLHGLGKDRPLLSSHLSVETEILP